MNRHSSLKHPLPQLTRTPISQIIGILWSKACRHFPLNESNDNCLHETPKLINSSAFWESAEDLDRCLWAALPPKLSQTAPDEHGKATLEPDEAFSSMGLSGPNVQRLQGALPALHRVPGNLALVCRYKQTSEVPLSVLAPWERKRMMLELPGGKQAFHKEGCSYSSPRTLLPVTSA